jgi:hypothetical protein
MPQSPSVSSVIETKTLELKVALADAITQWAKVGDGLALLLDAAIESPLPFNADSAYTPHRLEPKHASQSLMRL